ncbi:MAG TPA: hypothetical protein VGC24_02725 [Burkholderiaceae bacterium]
MGCSLIRQSAKVLQSIGIAASVTALSLLATPHASLAANQSCTADRDGRLVCSAPDSVCANDQQGRVVCSAPGGGLEFDRYGAPVCGPGYCTKDQRGEVLCSSAARGSASVDRYGNAACTGSCVAARASLCVEAQPAK